MSETWEEAFLDAYRSHRLADQAEYYGRRSRQYERARRWSVTTTAVLLVLAACFGALGTADAARRAMWAFLAATASAIATAMISYEASFGFERYSRQYRETQRALRLLSARGPRREDLRATDGGAHLHAFVTDVERLLGSEVESWAEHARRSDESGTSNGGRSGD